MAKGAKPDKQDQVTGMFSKIAKEAKRNERRAIKEAKAKGEFIKLEHPELLSIKKQMEYFEALQKHRKGNGQYDIDYDQDNLEFPWPWKYAKVVEDK